MSVVAGRTIVEAQELLRNGGRIDFLGHSVDARILHDRLAAAVGLVGNKLGQFFHKLQIDNISFKSLPDNVVGEALDGRISIDPILLLHPVSRFTAVLAHELGHDGVPNEDLADAFVEVFFPGGVEGSAYEAKRMENFATKSGLSVLQLWQMYRKREFKKICTAYAEKNGGRSNAIKEMQILFPELTFTAVTIDYPKPGYWGVRQPDLSSRSVGGVQNGVNTNVAKAL